MLYLLHFDRPYRHAKHYLGFTKKRDLQSRLDRHARGDGARLLRVLKDAGIGWTLAWFGKGNRTKERRLKNNGGKSKWCPTCRNIKALDRTIDQFAQGRT